MIRENNQRYSSDKVSKVQIINDSSSGHTMAAPDGWRQFTWKSRNILLQQFIFSYQSFLEFNNQPGNNCLFMLFLFTVSFSPQLCQTPSSGQNLVVDFLSKLLSYGNANLCVYLLGQSKIRWKLPCFSWSLLIMDFLCQFQPDCSLNVY